MRSTFLILCAAIALASAQFAAAQIAAIGIAGDGVHTRITIFSESEIDANAYAIKNADQFELSVVADDIAFIDAPFFGSPMGEISSYSPQEEAINFVMNSPMVVSQELNLKPVGDDTTYRLIFDLAAVSVARFDQHAKRDAAKLNRARIMQAEAEAAARQPLLASADFPSLPLLKPRNFGVPQGLAAPEKYVIVIDPGHGGKDPGALSRSGGEEADIVLSASKKLKTLLEADGRYTVHLTRNDDTYVAHKDRVSKARDWGANLFVSIHADAAGRIGTSGASVYTISSVGAKRKEGVAEENGWHFAFEDDVADAAIFDILEDLTLRETKSNSAVFADLLVPELAKAGPLLRNTHRRKNLFVLLAPDVPAALVELGFMTSPSDHKRLSTAAGQLKSAKALKRGIDAYFTRQERLLASN